MIGIRRANKETRRRDSKRCRIILSVGSKHYHLSEKEALKLRVQLNRLVFVGAQDPIARYIDAIESLEKDLKAGESIRLKMHRQLHGI